MKEEKEWKSTYTRSERIQTRWVAEHPNYEHLIRMNRCANPPTNAYAASPPILWKIVWQDLFFLLQ